MNQLKHALWCALALCVSSQAQAATYYLDQSNTTPPFTEPADYLHISITDNGSGGYLFNLTLGSALTGYATAGIDKFAFNTDASVTFSGLPSGWLSTYSPNAVAMDGFGKFDAGVSFSGQSNANSLSFTVTPNTANFNMNSFGTCGQGCTWFSAHVKGLTTGYTDPATNQAVTSAYFGGSSTTAPVPAPAAVWLLGSGLIGLGGFLRRK